MTAPTLEPGAHAGVSMADYLALRMFSSGMACRLLTQSPLHAWVDSPWNPHRPQDANKASDAGTAAHNGILEGNFDSVAIIDPEQYRSKPTKDSPDGNVPKGWTNDAIRAAAVAARENGRVPILQDDMPAIRLMVDSVRDFIDRSAIAGVFRVGAPEITVVWDDDGVLCKARPDWDNPDICLHLKTTQISVRPESFERLAIRMGYPESLTFYARGIERRQHIILAVEQDAPHACKLFDLSAAQWDISARRVGRALKTWKECKRRGVYPAYDGSIHSIEPTAWEMAKEEQAMQMDELSDDELAGGVPA